MPELNTRLARRLSYAGLLPFLIPAALVWVLPQLSGKILGEIAISYSALVLSFIAGMIWILTITYQSSAAKLDEPSERNPNWVLTGSVSLSLFAWLCTWLPAWLACPGLMAGFILARKLEQTSVELHYPLWFIEMRDWLSRIVVASHISLAVFYAQL